MYSIQLRTIHGTAAFSFDVLPDGKVTAVECLSLGLPPAALRLTFPNVDPEELRSHLLVWESVIPHFVETGLWLDRPPAFLASAHARYRESTPDYDEQRTALLAIDPAEPENAPQHLVRVSTFFRMTIQRDIARFPDIRNQDKVLVDAGKLSLPYRRVVADWLITTFPLAGHRQVDEWLVMIGKTRTTEANEFLLREAERPGVLPYARQIYTVLANSRLKLPADRIVRLYNDEDNVRDGLKAYLHLLNQLPYPVIRELLERIVADHPGDALPAIKRLVRHDRIGAFALIQRIFRESPRYKTLMAMIHHMIRLLPPHEYFLDLRSINQRLLDPELHHEAQVTWPQRLHPAWLKILLAEEPQTVGAVVNDFLPGANAPTTRHLLLQLRAYLQDNPGAQLGLSRDAENTLYELLFSRYDKISTVATTIIELYFPQLHAPREAVSALLRHIEVSQYRMMDASALALAAQDDDLEVYQERYFRQRLSATTTEAEREQLLKLGPYLRHLSRWDKLVKDSEYQ